ncbi:MAG: bifunctional diaminohydroxyphosphoribosylaminopyrimidine deaminase/5-amino-6-(5-phosphoribosylamino)uracil reductase RibD [Spirulinaceae cyanobacterium]
MLSEERDRHWMQHCLALARRAIGRTAPNPMVGAVVIKDGQLIGEGWHPGAGQPHAEVFALQAAGAAAQGATVYVSLEPCNHYGRTPPCTEALINAGVSTVVVGMVDPDPRVSGTGIQRLRDAGIEVRVGIEQDACAQLNEAFIWRVTQGQPLSILKYAMTLDGKIATTTGHSAWVSGPAARKWVHQRRAESDAVIVGGNTVRQDNPNLTSHGMSDHNPLRVVMTRSLDLPPNANLWDVTVAPTRIYTLPDANPELQQRLGDRGVAVIPLPDLNPTTVLKDLYHQGLSQVFWECGGTLAAAALKAGVIQKVMAFVAPKIIGGATAPSPVGDLGLTEMGRAIVLERLTIQTVEPDLLVEGYIAKGEID